MGLPDLDPGQLVKTHSVEGSLVEISFNWENASMTMIFQRNIIFYVSIYFVKKGYYMYVSEPKSKRKIMIILFMCIRLLFYNIIEDMCYFGVMEKKCIYVNSAPQLG